jgi:hypothetical protein
MGLMDFISILIGILLGSSGVLIGIGLKILYNKIKPYLELFSFAKKELIEPKKGILGKIMDELTDNEKDKDVK